MKNKRAFKSVVVDSSAQLRMFVPFAILTCAHVGGFIWLNEATQRLFARYQARQNDELTAAVLAISHAIVTVSVSSMLIFTALMLILWIRYTHRIFGPVVALNRQLDRLITGDLSGQVQLRQADELKSTAAKLNALTAKLASDTPQS